MRKGPATLDVVFFGVKNQGSGDIVNDGDRFFLVDRQGVPQCLAAYNGIGGLFKIDIIFGRIAFSVA